MNSDTLWLIIGIVVLAYIIYRMLASKPIIPSNLNADLMNKKDILEAQFANRDVTCISIMVTGISPYDGKLVEVGSPCDLDWLVTNRNWKKPRQANPVNV